MEKEQIAVICPYNKSHVIHKTRIQQHLLKCSRQYPANYLETCPFNATHLMPRAELASHIEQCSDRKYVDSSYSRYDLRNHGSIKPCPPSDAESCVGLYSDIWEQDDIPFDNFSNSVRMNNSSNIPPKTEKLTRRPYGCSEVMMLETDEESNVEDVESVTSSMGRGKIISRNLDKKKSSRRVGKGRGQCLAELMKVGTSANTDVEDLESVAESIETND